jgi:hypothetical protein
MVRRFRGRYRRSSVGRGPNAVSMIRGYSEKKASPCRMVIVLSFSTQITFEKAFQCEKCVLDCDHDKTNQVKVGQGCR